MEWDGSFSCLDYVYVQSEYLCESYRIGRIQSIIEVEEEIYIEVAWFLRSKDLELEEGEIYLQSGFSEDDCRHIYATMTTSYIRDYLLKGICQVNHLEVIEDLESYRKQEDSFYYYQLYDRNTKWIYDMMPKLELRYVATMALPYILPFSYILIRSMKCLKIEEFRRLCNICQKWLGGNERRIFKCEECEWKVHKSCYYKQKEDEEMKEGRHDHFQTFMMDEEQKEEVEEFYDVCLHFDCTDHLKSYIGEIKYDESMELISKRWPFRYVNMKELTSIYPPSMKDMKFKEDEEVQDSCIENENDVRWTELNCEM
jgi:hypothetical protein